MPVLFILAELIYQRCDTNPCIWLLLAYLEFGHNIFIDNFFLYANGNWMKNNPIPSGYPSWNSFMALRLKSQEDCKTILSELEEKLKAGDSSITDEERKVALFYKSAMDEDAIEKVGVAPMKELLDLCEMAASVKDDKVEFAKALGRIALKYSITPFFAIGGG